MTPEQWELVRDDDFILEISHRLGRLWQQRQFENDAKFQAHWKKLSWWEKYFKPLP